MRRQRRWGGLLVAVGLAIVLGAARAVAATDADSLERTRAMVEQFKARFVTIGPALAENVEQLYTEDVRFRDPITTVNGIDALRGYLRRFGEVSAGARFEITGEIVTPGDAAVFWTMVLAGKRGKDGRRFDGVSHLKVRDRVYEERDYFDLGDAVYDHVPVVSWFTRLVRAYLD